MGDFTGKTDERALEDREPINIDKDNFNEVLKGQGVGVDVTVPNKLSGEPDEDMNVSLKFASMKDFEPEAVAKNTPELSRLMELRDALGSLKGPLSNVPDFRKKIQELVKDEASREKIMKELGVEDK